MTAPVPRPAEEPDREARRALAVRIYYAAHGSTWAETSLEEDREGTDAVLALLPTPPAPGGGDADLRGDRG